VCVCVCERERERERERESILPNACGSPAADYDNVFPRKILEFEAWHT
jgi:hypothetical protein